jgi:hypothetical protein
MILRLKKSSLAAIHIAVSELLSDCREPMLALAFYPAADGKDIHPVAARPIF